MPVAASRPANLHAPALRIPSPEMPTWALKRRCQWCWCLCLAVQKTNQKKAWRLLHAGVRNHQAKKVLQSMRVGDRAFFYHSNAKPPGIVGIVEVRACYVGGCVCVWLWVGG